MRTSDDVAGNEQVDTSAGAELETLVTVLQLVRSGDATTRPELSRRSGLGRAVVSQRVDRLQRAGLVEEVGLGRSTGGRLPRRLGFRADAGSILVADLGATSIAAGVTDMGGALHHWHEEPADIATGPEAVLGRLEEIWDKQLAEADMSPVVGVGVGLPGPVEFANGRPVSPPIMPGWDDYGVRERLGARYRAPTWVDNEVNTMALGELRVGLAKDHRNVVVVKLGTGIGAGLVAGAALHRGVDGCAGDLGHVRSSDDASVICRCGNIGCLEAHAGGGAIARAAAKAATEGRSAMLAAILAENGAISARDVSLAATRGDRTSSDLLVDAGRRIGSALATVVNLLNPEMIILGGGLANAGDRLIAVIRQHVYERSLPLATRRLSIVRSQLGDIAGVVGAAHMVIDELFSPNRIGRWIDDGTPAGKPELAVS